MKVIYSIMLFALTGTMAQGQNSKRWNLSSDGSIQWNVKKDSAHIDNIEMSGSQMSAIIHYGINDNGELRLTKKLIFPMLRMARNYTYDCFIADLNENDQLLQSVLCWPHPGPLVDKNDTSGLQIFVDGVELKEYPSTFNLRGKVSITSSTNTKLETERVLFPSTDKPALVEMIKFKNKGVTPCIVKVRNNTRVIETDPTKGIYGKYVLTTSVIRNKESNQEIQFSLAPNEESGFTKIYSARKSYEEPYYSYSPSFELEKREKFIAEMFENLILETPNDSINREFAFSKIRAAESIFDTRDGLMHGPGGACYYAAIWACDEAEYINPFYPFLGNVNGNESALNCYRQYARYMNNEFRPLPSEINGEATGIWNTVDLGDMAMIANGASKFALFYGNKENAKEIFTLIKWCLEYLERQKTSGGVIASESDEMEGRSSTGKANLYVSSDTYGAYINAASLADELNKPELASSYRKKAQELKDAIEKYFGTNVQGFNTYQFYAGNTTLRTVIGYALANGITERKNETIKALFSKYLWTPNGFLIEAGKPDFWDRYTLTAFRGLFACGATDISMDHFSYYTATRLLGEHVPYPVEAWPEGDQRHLSTDAGMYCRVIIEGLFGITPTGLNKFSLTPRLPDGWNYMNLRRIHAFGYVFDIEVRRKGSGEMIQVKMADGATITKKWDGKAPVAVVLP
jgi:hypothetical protein